MTGTTYASFLERIIDDGIEAAKRDYDKPKDKPKLEGSIAGFEACRGLDPIQLASLLNTAARRTHRARIQDPENYWVARCYEGEVGWVCNVVSAALMNSGQRVIVAPTAGGVRKAAEILGVSDG